MVLFQSTTVISGEYVSFWVGSTSRFIWDLSTRMYITYPVTATKDLHAKFDRGLTLAALNVEGRLKD